MSRNRFDETWHLLREWTSGQAKSERLAAQILLHEGFAGLDPSHPLGGPDGGKDALAVKNNSKYVMAVYFLRGQKKWKEIEEKFAVDVEGARKNKVDGIAFVSNQELTLSQRQSLKLCASHLEVQIYHLERIATLLDSPPMFPVRAQFLDIHDEDSGPVLLGGQGGMAPGAGGGGGGAMGDGATGGDGGSGGNINLNGTPGQAPGAGGGGAGAVGEGAIGGEGGGGGESIRMVLGPEEIGPDTGFHHAEITVGEGGREGPGENTLLNLCDEAGNVLRTIVARGGEAGAPPFVPPPSRELTANDLENGFCIGGVIAADFIRSGSEGLWTIVYGGWEFFVADTSPYRFHLPLLFEVETGGVNPDEILKLKIVSCRPDNKQVSEQFEYIRVPSGLVRRVYFAAAVEISGSQAGIWKVKVVAGEQVLREFPLEVRISS